MLPRVVAVVCAVGVLNSTALGDRGDRRSGGDEKQMVFPLGSQIQDMTKALPVANSGNLGLPPAASLLNTFNPISAGIMPKMEIPKVPKVDMPNAKMGNYLSNLSNVASLPNMAMGGLPSISGLPMGFGPSKPAKEAKPTNPTKVAKISPSVGELDEKQMVEMEKQQHMEDIRKQLEEEMTLPTVDADMDGIRSKIGQNRNFGGESRFDEMRNRFDREEFGSEDSDLSDRIQQIRARQGLDIRDKDDEDGEGGNRRMLGASYYEADGKQRLARTKRTTMSQNEEDLIRAALRLEMLKAELGNRDGPIGRRKAKKRILHEEEDEGAKSRMLDHHDETSYNELHGLEGETDYKVPEDQLLRAVMEAARLDQQQKIRDGLSADYDDTISSYEEMTHDKQPPPMSDADRAKIRNRSRAIRKDASSMMDVEAPAQPCFEKRTFNTAQGSTVEAHVPCGFTHMYETELDEMSTAAMMDAEDFTDHSAAVTSARSRAREILTQREKLRSKGGVGNLREEGSALGIDSSSIDLLEGYGVDDTADLEYLLSPAGEDELNDLLGVATDEEIDMLLAYSGGGSGDSYTTGGYDDEYRLGNEFDRMVNPPFAYGPGASPTLTPAQMEQLRRRQAQFAGQYMGSSPFMGSPSMGSPSMGYGGGMSVPPSLPHMGLESPTCVCPPTGGMSDFSQLAAGCGGSGFPCVSRSSIESYMRSLSRRERAELRRHMEAMGYDIRRDRMWGRDRDGMWGRDRDGMWGRDRDGMWGRDRDGMWGRDRDGMWDRDRDGMWGRERDGMWNRERGSRWGRRSGRWHRDKHGQCFVDGYPANTCPSSYGEHYEDDSRGIFRRGKAKRRHHSCARGKVRSRGGKCKRVRSPAYKCSGTTDLRHAPSCRPELTDLCGDGFELRGTKCLLQFDPIVNCPGGTNMLRGKCIPSSFPTTHMSASQMSQYAQYASASGMDMQTMQAMLANASPSTLNSISSGNIPPGLASSMAAYAHSQSPPSSSSMSSYSYSQLGNCPQEFVHHEDQCIPSGRQRMGMRGRKLLTRPVIATCPTGYIPLDETFSNFQQQSFGGNLGMMCGRIVEAEIACPDGFHMVDQTQAARQGAFDGSYDVSSDSPVICQRTFRQRPVSTKCRAGLSLSADGMTCEARERKSLSRVCERGRLEGSRCVETITEAAVPYCPDGQVLDYSAVEPVCRKTRGGGRHLMAGAVLPQYHCRQADAEHLSRDMCARRKYSAPTMMCRNGEIEPLSGDCVAHTRERPQLLCATPDGRGHTDRCLERSYRKPRHKCPQGTQNVCYDDSGIYPTGGGGRLCPAMCMERARPTSMRHLGTGRRLQSASDADFSKASVAFCPSGSELISTGDEEFCELKTDAAIPEGCNSSGAGCGEGGGEPFCPEGYKFEGKKNLCVEL